MTTIVPYFEIYKDSSGGWRWRFVASNGKIIAMSSEAYVHKSDAEHGIDLLKQHARDAVVKQG